MTTQNACTVGACCDDELSDEEVRKEWEHATTQQRPLNAFGVGADVDAFYRAYIPKLQQPYCARRLLQLEDALQFVAANEQDFRLLLEQYATAVEDSPLDTAVVQAVSHNTNGLDYTFEIKQDHYTVRIDFEAVSAASLLFPLETFSPRRLEQVQTLFSDDLAMLVVPSPAFPSSPAFDLHFGSFASQYGALPAQMETGDTFLTFHSSLLAHVVAHTSFATAPFVFATKADEGRFFLNLLTLCDSLRVRRLFFALHTSPTKRETMVLIFHNLKEAFFALRFTALRSVTFLFEGVDEAAQHAAHFRQLQAKAAL